MYKKAGDIKSNLILTALSWVDYLKPKLVYFENVPGFLRFSFDAEQAGQHKVEGGIPMGGMKFIVRALIDLGYVDFYPSSLTRSHISFFFPQISNSLRSPTSGQLWNSARSRSSLHYRSHRRPAFT